MLAEQGVGSPPIATRWQSHAGLREAVAYMSVWLACAGSGRQSSHQGSVLHPASNMAGMCDASSSFRVGRAMFSQHIGTVMDDLVCRPKEEDSHGRAAAKNECIARAGPPSQFPLLPWLFQSRLPLRVLLPPCCCCCRHRHSSCSCSFSCCCCCRHCCCTGSSSANEHVLVNECQCQCFC